MFELGIFGVILFAIGYWTTLFIMGRREDVLHGEFVEAEPELMATPLPASPVPMRMHATVVTAAAGPLTVAVVPQPPAEPVAVSAAPVTVTNPEALQSLLASIKQELKNAAQI